MAVRLTTTVNRIVRYVSRLRIINKESGNSIFKGELKLKILRIIATIVHRKYKVTVKIVVCRSSPLFLYKYLLIIQKIIRVWLLLRLLSGRLADWRVKSKEIKNKMPLLLKPIDWFRKKWQHPQLVPTINFP
jgi:hypothetical protein